MTESFGIVRTVGTNQHALSIQFVFQSTDLNTTGILVSAANSGNSNVKAFNVQSAKLAANFTLEGGLFTANSSGGIAIASLDEYQFGYSGNMASVQQIVIPTSEFNSVQKYTKWLYQDTSIFPFPIGGSASNPFSFYLSLLGSPLWQSYPNGLPILVTLYDFVLPACNTQAIFDLGDV